MAKAQSRKRPGGKAEGRTGGIADLIDGGVETEEPPSGRNGRGSDPLDSLRRSLVDGEADGAEDEHAWMTTYTDMVTLLLTCFILLVSLASFTDRREARVSLSTVPVPAVTDPVEPPPPPIQQPETRVPDALFVTQPPDRWTARLSRQLRAYVDSRELQLDVTVIESETEVTVRLNNAILFASAAVEVQPGGRTLLADLADPLAASPARIEVRGHTDSVPIDNWLFPSNWELASARAAAVVRVLIGAGVPAERLSAVGFADTRPIADDATAEGRRENRRVELVLRTPFDPPLADRAPPEATRSDGASNR